METSGIRTRQKYSSLRRENRLADAMDGPVFSIEEVRSTYARLKSTSHSLEGEKMTTADLDPGSHNLRVHFEGIATGTREFAGHVVMKIDRMMAGLSLRDQEVLYELRKAICAEISRRYPTFDLETESQRHA